MATTIKKIQKTGLDKLFKKVVHKSRKNPSAFFGKSKDGLDGLTYQRKLRNEWK